MKNCKWCDTEFEGRGDYCSDKCLFENKFHLLTNDKIALEEKVRLLNIERTCVFPDITLTEDQNLTIIKLAHQKLIDEMSPECIAIHLKCQYATIEQTHLVVAQLGMATDILNKHNKKIKEVEKQRDVESLPRQKVLKDRELWLRSWLVQNIGPSNGKIYTKEELMQAEHAYKQMQMREKAIDGFMKIPGMTREHAELMAQQADRRKQ